MSKLSHQSARALYDAFEAQLSPLLRQRLSRALPAIAGRNWWRVAVEPALSDMQRHYVSKRPSLDELDYPALVNVCHKNWVLLRQELDVDDKLRDCLFTIKKFRNEVVHKPGFSLDPTYRRLLEDSCCLAVSQLEGRTATKPSPTGWGRRLALAGGVATAVLAGALAWLTLTEPEVVTPNEAIDYVGKEKTVCGILAQVNRKDAVVFLNLDATYPDNRFAGVIREREMPEFVGIEGQVGKRVCFKGKIEPMGRAKTHIRLRETLQWVR